MINKTKRTIIQLAQQLALGLAFITPLNAEPQKPGEDLS